MSGQAFDSLMASTDPPLVVVTTTAEGERAGCVVGFHSQSSMETGHYSLWLSKANHTYRVALRATHFAVHFLTSADLDVAASFGTRSGEDVDKFADVDVEAGPHGVPLLAARPHRIVLERLALLDVGGDHACFIGRVLSAESGGAFTPLRVSDAEGLSPGHEPQERAIDP